MHAFIIMRTCETDAIHAQSQAKEWATAYLASKDLLGDDAGARPHSLDDYIDINHKNNNI